MKYSPKFSLVKEDWSKIGKGLLIQLLGSTGAFLVAIPTNMELDVNTVLIVGLLANIVNFLYKFLREAQYK